MDDGKGLLKRPGFDFFKDFAIMFELKLLLFCQGLRVFTLSKEDVNFVIISLTRIHFFILLKAEDTHCAANYNPHFNMVIFNQ